MFWTAAIQSVATMRESSGAQQGISDATCLVVVAAAAFGCVGKGSCFVRGMGGG